MFQALLAEGKDPDYYEFDSNEKKPKRLSTNARKLKDLL